MVKENSTIRTLLHSLEAMEKRLEKLEKKKMIGGENIIITDLGDGRTLLESPSQDEAAEELLAERLDEFRNDLQQTLFAGPGIIAGPGLIQRSPGYLEVDPACLESDQTASGNGNTMEDFPFRVRLKNGFSDVYDGSRKDFIVCGCSSSAEALPEALIYFGTATPFRIDSYSFSTAETGYVYLRIMIVSSGSEINSGKITTEFVFSDGIPDPTNQLYVVPLARIVIRDGRVRIHQMQFGNIYIAGRII